MPLQLIMAKARHESPRTVMRYVKPGDAAVAEITSLLGPSSAAATKPRHPISTGSLLAPGSRVLTNTNAVSSPEYWAQDRSSQAELAVKPGVPWVERNAATRRLARKSAGYAYGPAMIFGMAAIAGRRRRASTGGVHVLLQGRVDPAIKERADRGAAARGVSIARYLEILIEGDEMADSYVEPDSCEQLDLGMSA